MSLRVLFLSLIISKALISEAQYVSQVWNPDRGDGTYTNPVIHADYSDPDLCRAGDDYFMTASSFNSSPGLPILHSRDLVNWEIVNYAIKNQQPAEVFNIPQHGKGVWAPTIRFHKGEFFIFWGDPDFGIYMVKTKDPYGEWEKPLLIKGGKGMIDPSPLWDDDGRLYMVHAWAGSRIGMNSIIVLCELDAATYMPKSNPVMIFDGNDGVNHTIEGPKFYKRNGYYYIFAPAGGVETGWQLAMRSKDIYGPYEPRIVMAQGSTDINGPHQGGWVETPQGESWFMHFQDKGAYGRILHLNPMTWRDDWPVIGEDANGDGCGEPVKRFRKPVNDNTCRLRTPAESDSFMGTDMGKQWQWHANYQDWFGYTTNMGFMRIYSHIKSAQYRNFWEVPNLLLQKFPAEEFTATTKVSVGAKGDGQQSGLIVMGLDYCRIGVEKKGERFILKQTVCADAISGGRETEKTIAKLPYSNRYEAGLFPNYDIELWLRVKVSKGGICRFYYSTDGERFEEAGKEFIASKGRWIGAKVGLYSVAPHGGERGWIDVDSFNVEK